MLQQMRSAGVPPGDQTYAYNSLLGAYARRGFTFRQSTFELLEEMSDAGIVESSTFNTLMDAAIECDDPEVPGPRRHSRLGRSAFATAFAWLRVRDMPRCTL